MTAVAEQTGQWWEQFAGQAPAAEPWIQALRDRAFARFNELGFPTTREEEWVGIGVGIVGLVVGTYLVVTGARSKPVPASTAGRVKVLPVVGLGTSSLELSGTW